MKPLKIHKQITGGTSMKWFKHMSGAGDDPALQRIRAEFGMVGIGRYWTIMEEIAKSMELNGAPEAARTINQWCSILECKPKILMDFLHSNDLVFTTKQESNRNLTRTKQKPNSFLLIISAPKLLKLVDNHTKNLQAINRIEEDKNIEKKLDTNVSNQEKIEKQKPVSPPAAPATPSPCGEKNEKIVLPEWLDSEIWQEFKQMRGKIKKPMTKRAEILLLSKLDRLRTSGNSPNEVLEQSIVNCWQDVYEIKQQNRLNHGNTSHKKETFADLYREADENLRALKSLEFGGFDPEQLRPVN